MSLNNVGEKFSLEKLREAQLKTKEVVQKTASRAFVGMSEEDGMNLLEEEFKKVGDIKFWHPHKFRIGKNTLCAFKDISDHSVRLEKNGHFFIDVGPILYEHEGDYGETFFLGENSDVENLKSVCVELFDIASKKFLKENCSGKDLYSFLQAESIKRKVNLNLKTLGHRIGDFPHHLFYRGKMADVGEILLPNLWVLEIQISNSDETIGIFYEDIL